MSTAESAVMELPGYTVSEFETLAGIPRKVGYALIKEGKLGAYTDSEGRLRVSPFEAFHYLRSKEEK